MLAHGGGGGLRREPATQAVGRGRDHAVGRHPCWLGPACTRASGWSPQPQCPGLSAGGTSRMNASSPQGHPGRKCYFRGNSCLFPYDIAGKGTAFSSLDRLRIPSCLSWCWCWGVGTVATVADPPAPVQPEPHPPRATRWAHGTSPVLLRPGEASFLTRAWEGREAGPCTTSGSQPPSVALGGQCLQESVFPKAGPPWLPEPRQAPTPPDGISYRGARAGRLQRESEPPMQAVGRGGDHAVPGGDHGCSSADAECHGAAGRGRAVPGPAGRSHAGRLGEEPALCAHGVHHGPGGGSRARGVFLGTRVDVWGSRGRNEGAGGGFRACGGTASTAGHTRDPARGRKPASGTRGRAPF